VLLYNKSLCKFDEWKFNQEWLLRRVWRYQPGNKNPEIEESQTTQWPEEKGQKDKQRSTKHYTQNKRSSKANPLKNRE